MKRTFFLCALLVWGPAAAAQDLVTFKGGKPRRGTVFDDDQERVRFNPYFSTHKVMTWGVEEVARARIKAIEPSPSKRDAFHRDLATHQGAIDELVALAGRARKSKLKLESELALEHALLLDREHGGALKALGSRRAGLFLRTNPDANPELRAALDEWLGQADAGERRRTSEGLIKRFRLPWKREHFARAYRSSQLPRGLSVDRSLRFRGDTIKGVYTLFVPSSYDPFQPTPLIVGLHGGGRGGQRGDLVVGSGKAAMSFYRSEAERRGYIVVCPTALRAPWSAGVNDAWLRALLAETKALFNIDLNRVYLTGHSMGGFGTWHFGPKYCDEWAAIGPMAGGGSNGFARLRATGTPVYVYHGGNDNVVSPRDSRRAAEALLRDGGEFIYTEIPDSGHGFPRSVLKEMLDWFHAKRRVVKGVAQARPSSSFAAKESEEERRYFGPLVPRSTSSGPSIKALVKQLAGGGGAGAAAAERLGALGDPKVGSALVRVLKNRKATADGRALAARVLGEIGFEKALKPLTAAAREGHPELHRDVVTALRKLEGPGVADAILGGVDSLIRYFEERRTGERSMSYSDWDRILPLVAFGIDALDGVEGVQAVARLQRGAVEKILLPRFTVPHSTRVRQNPERARSTLIRSVCAALARVAPDDAAEVGRARGVLQELAKRYDGTAHAADITRAVASLEDTER